jgi:isopenicillin N synthase-like dioxygenase
LTGIPTIDLRSASAAHEIGEAGATVGFFQIVGHGVDDGVIGTAWREARRFFDLPLADRMTVAQRAGDAYGFSPMEGEALERSLGTMDSAADLKQTFNVGPEPMPDVDLDHPVAAWAFGPTPWPAALPSLEPAMRAYFDAMDALARRLLRLFAIALDQPHDVLRAVRRPGTRGAARARLPRPRRPLPRSRPAARRRAHRLRHAHDPAPGRRAQAGSRCSTRAPTTWTPVPAHVSTRSS